MPLIPAYKNPKTRQALLDVLRRGGSRQAACDAAKVKFGSFLRWVDNDATFEQEVRAAEAEAIATGAAREALAVKPNPKDAQTGADRWKKLREEAEAFGGGMFGSLKAIEARVLRAPDAVGLSPFWTEVARQFYEGGYHELCVIAGRGGGKSTANIFLACNELMFRERTIPPNDPLWIWPFMSHNMAESSQRYEPFKYTLKAVGYPEADLNCHQVKDGRSDIRFHDVGGREVKINIFPNTVDACRGGNLAGATDDEEEHWAANKDKGLSRADDVLAVLVNSFRADRSRVHVRISSISENGGAMLDAANAGSDEFRFVPTLGTFLQAALDGFCRVAEHLDKLGIVDGAKRVRSWAATLEPSSPWIPSWVGNPSHDPVEGFKLLWSKLRRDQDRVGIWLRENGSCSLPVGASGALYEYEQTERAAMAIVYPGSGPRFAAIDTGASKNPAALGIAERVEYKARYQWRPKLLRQWKRKKGEGPLDLRGVVLPEMAHVLLAFGCEPAWWSDGWSGHDVTNVGAENGIETIFVSTSTAMRDICAPFASALALSRGDAVVLSGCENVEVAVAQLRGIREAPGGGVIWPKVGDDHGELAQVLLRAMAHAEIGRLAGSSADFVPSFGFFDGKYSAHRRGLASR
jgi:hypothetical protein